MDMLIGHTGFIGSNLSKQHRFHATFNSSNIDQASGQEFDLAVCAAPSATMWAANKDPEGDRSKIDALLVQLGRIRIKRMILISTIAVLDKADAGYTESFARYELEKAYGRNRRALELGVQAGFRKSYVLRLPALFGQGLKKNFLFDILNPTPSFLAPEKFEALISKMTSSDASLIDDAYTFDDDLCMYVFARDRFRSAVKCKQIEAIFIRAGFSALNFVNPLSSYQYYGLDALWSDIQKCVLNDIQVMHLAPEPLGANEIYGALTGNTLQGGDVAVYREDMRTEYASAWGSHTPYIESRDRVLSRLKKFYADEERAA